MSVRRTGAVVALLFGVGLGGTACRQQAEPPSQPAAAPQGSDAALPPELRGIQTTLDAIDSELASDGSG
jgi:hypothetical protein